MESLYDFEIVSETQIQVKWAGEDIQLYSDFSLEIRKEWLVISDLHLGKVQHFRNNGIAIPAAIKREAILQLETLVQKHRLQKLVFLGDLFHSDPNSEWNDFFDWMETHPEIEFILVVGNHDQKFLNSTFSNRILCVSELLLGPFILLHEEDSKRKDGFQISGHIHPKVRIRGRARQSINMPCFHFNKQSLVLPAFGPFTGAKCIKPMKGSKSIGLAANRLWPIAH